MNGEVRAAGTLPAVPGMTVRAIRADDASALQAFHRRLSSASVRSRFFGPHPVLSDEEARRFTSLDSRQQVALVAVLADVIVGVGRYIRLEAPDVAEVAFVVEDGYQGHGIGTELLALLARIGWDDGVRSFVAETLATNHAMLKVFRTRATVTVVEAVRDHDVVRLTMSLTPPRADLIPASARWNS